MRFFVFLRITYGRLKCLNASELLLFYGLIIKRIALSPIDRSYPNSEEANSPIVSNLIIVTVSKK